MPAFSIRLFPLWGEFKKYSLSKLRADSLSAFSVALLALPQAIAYAFLADLPPSAGIWAAVFGTIFTSAFGESRYLVSGPTNVIAILIESGTSEILYTYFRDAGPEQKEILVLSIMLQIVLLIGIFQALAGLFKFGRLIQFASRSVLVGYITGAALAIIIVQLFPFFGIKRSDGYQPLYLQAYYILSHLSLLHLPTAALAFICLMALVFFTKISPKIPVPAIVIFLAAAFVYFLHLSPENLKGTFEITVGEPTQKITLLKDAGPLYSELPYLHLPYFQLQVFAKLIPLAFAIALIGALEVTSIGRLYSREKDRIYQDNQEIFALGISNIISSFLGAMPSSGSFSRSALNYTLKAKTRFSALFSGIFVFIYVVALGFLVVEIPLAALSALMLYTAYCMVDFKQLLICLKTTPADAGVVVVTIASSLIFTLDVALYIGVILSIVLYLRQAAVPAFIEYAFNNTGKLRPLDSEDERPDPRICIIQVEGELFFGAASHLQSKLRDLAEDETIRVVILQLLNIRRVDASICLALRHVLRYLHATGRRLLLSGVSPEVWNVLERSGFLKEIGPENCFLINEQLPSDSTRNAYASAKSIIIG